MKRINDGVCMKKTLTAVLVILLSSLGFKALASSVDGNVNRKVIEVNGDTKGNDNHGDRTCGTKRDK